MMAAMMACKDHDHDKGKHSSTMMALAVIVILIVFFIAIIFLALAMKRDRGEIGAEQNRGGNMAELLTGIAAINSMGGKGCGHGGGCGCGGNYQIYEKLEHGEDRAVARQTQNEIGEMGKAFMQMGFGLSEKIGSVNDRANENFAKVENQLGQLTQAVSCLLQGQNNDLVADKVYLKLNRCC
jgi:hypothetical protein